MRAPYNYTKLFSYTMYHKGTIEFSYVVSSDMLFKKDYWPYIVRRTQETIDWVAIAKKGGKIARARGMIANSSIVLITDRKVNHPLVQCSLRIKQKDLDTIRGFKWPREKLGTGNWSMNSVKVSLDRITYDDWISRNEKMSMMRPAYVFIIFDTEANWMKLTELRASIQRPPKIKPMEFSERSSIALMDKYDIDVATYLCTLQCLSDYKRDSNPIDMPKKHLAKLLGEE